MSAPHRLDWPRNGVPLTLCGAVDLAEYIRAWRLGWRLVNRDLPCPSWPELLSAVRRCEGAE